MLKPMRLNLEPLTVTLTLAGIAASVACGGSENDSISGVESSKQLGQLTAAEGKQFCEYVLDSLDYRTAGRVACYSFGRQFGGTVAQCNDTADACLDELPVPNLDDCIEDTANCPVTVQEAEACYEASARAYADAAPYANCTSQTAPFAPPSACDKMVELCTRSE